MKIKSIFLLTYWVIAPHLHSQSFGSKEIRNPTYTDTGSTIREHNLDLTLDLTSNYVWRDIAFNYPALQPNVAVNFSNSDLSLNLWQSVGRNRTIVDLQTSTSLAYNFKFSDLFCNSAGIVYYSTVEVEKRPNDHSSEVFATLDILTLFDPGCTFYLNNTKELYTSIYLSQSVVRSQRLSAELHSNLGYRLNSKNNNGLRDINMELETSISHLNVHLGFFLKGTYIREEKKIYGLAGLRSIIE